MCQIALWHLTVREELGPVALKSGAFRVSLGGCVWRLGSTLPYLATRQNRKVADSGCREHRVV